MTPRGRFSTVDLTGQTFGYLKVIKKSEERDKNCQWLWVCRCVCKQIKNISTWRLTSGKVKSCGCRKNEMIGEGVRKKANKKWAQKILKDIDK